MIKNKIALALAMSITANPVIGGLNHTTSTEVERAAIESKVLNTDSFSITIEDANKNARTVNNEDIVIKSQSVMLLEDINLTILERKQELERARIEAEKKAAEEAARKAEEERIRQEIAAENNRKNNVHFDPYDLSSLSGISATELYEVLNYFNGGSLSQLAWAFVEAEQCYGVNALFMTALVAQESGWGTSYRAQYQNNMTGHAVYNSNAEGTTFSSKDESVLLTAEMLQNNYLTPGGRQYKGLSIWNVNSSYCFNEAGTEPDYHWSDNISAIAYQLNETYHGLVKVLE